MAVAGQRDAAEGGGDVGVLPSGKHQKLFRRYARRERLMLKIRNYLKLVFAALSAALLSFNASAHDRDRPTGASNAPQEIIQNLFLLKSLRPEDVERLLPLQLHCVSSAGVKIGGAPEAYSYSGKSSVEDVSLAYHTIDFSRGVKFKLNIDEHRTCITDTMLKGATTASANITRPTKSIHHQQIYWKYQLGDTALLTFEFMNGTCVSSARVSGSIPTGLKPKDIYRQCGGPSG